jgi:transcriptional regulator with XRE-family HTH domain
MMFRRDQMQETQREISLRAGMSLNRWKLLERGAVEPSIADARKLYAVGIPACVLLGMTENTLPLGVERMSEAQCSLFFVFGGNSRMNAGLSHGDESATPQAR